jgi:hypothetical protein
MLDHLQLLLALDLRYQRLLVRQRNLEPTVPVQRYEWNRPCGLIHSIVMVLA